MRKSIFLMLACLLIVASSCSKAQKKNIRNSIVDNSSINNQKQEIDEDKYYHAEMDSMDGIEATALNAKWTKIFIMTNDRIKKYDKDNLYADMVVALQKDIDGNGQIEKIVTGTYVDGDGEDGAFMSIIDSKNNMILTDIVSDQPRLVHMRDVGDAIFFGTGYGSEYFKQIIYNGNNIEISPIPLE